MVAKFYLEEIIKKIISFGGDKIMDKDTLRAIESIKNLLKELFEVHPFSADSIDDNFHILYDILKTNKERNKHG